MTAFLKSLVAAAYICRHTRSDLARSRALGLQEMLGICEAALAGQDGDPAAPAQAMVGELVLAVRDLAGRAWLAAHAGDPDISAFTALQHAPGPPAPAVLDEILSRCLWARFAPANPQR
jgi:hypothetical protein